MTSFTDIAPLQDPVRPFPGQSWFGRVFRGEWLSQTRKTPSHEELERLMRARTESEEVRRRTDHLLMYR